MAKTTNDLQNITHKTKDWVTRTPMKTESELRYSEKLSSSCSTNGTRCVNLVTNPVICHEWGINNPHKWLQISNSSKNKTLDVHLIGL